MTKSKVDTKALEQVENNFKEVSAPEFLQDVDNLVDIIDDMYSHCVNLTTMGFISTSFLNIFAQKVKQLNNLEAKTRSYIKNNEVGRAEQYLDILSNSIELKAFELGWKRLSINHDNFIKSVAMQSNNPDAIIEMIPSSQEILEKCINYSVQTDAKKAKELTEMLDFARKAII